LSERPKVLFAHERRPIAHAVERVLTTYGFSVATASDAAAAQTELQAGVYDGFVVDVALPGIGGFELIARSREWGVKAVILVASVYRRTSYKRRPTRLYGADDYVEVHHLGDQLPDKLRRHLGLSPIAMGGGVIHKAVEELKREGDARLDGGTPHRIASLIVADLVLYNGDTVAAVTSVEEARQRLQSDLDGARELFAQVHAEDDSPVEGDPIGDAFSELMVQLQAHPPEDSR
jgi:CheY-like chemotaxis protein